MNLIVILLLQYLKLYPDSYLSAGKLAIIVIKTNMTIQDDSTEWAESVVIKIIRLDSIL